VYRSGEGEVWVGRAATRGERRRDMRPPPWEGEVWDERIEKGSIIHRTVLDSNVGK
jgi:hypothetical protein